jgi:hypothetical protein
MRVRGIEKLAPLLTVAALLVVLPAAAEITRYDGQKVVVALIETQEDFDLVNDLSSRYLSCEATRGEVVFLVPQENMLALDDTGVVYTVAE